MYVGMCGGGGAGGRVFLTRFRGRGGHKLPSGGSAKERMGWRQTLPLPFLGTLDYSMHQIPIPPVNKCAGPGVAAQCRVFV